LAEILSLSQGAANILKALIQSTTRVRTLKQTCTFPLICDDQVINSWAAVTWSSLLVAALN